MRFKLSPPALRAGGFLRSGLAQALRDFTAPAESAARGIFTEVEEGVMRNPKVYRAVQDQVGIAAQRAGRDVRDYSDDVRIGIRETVQKTDALFGTPYKGSAIPGESKSVADLSNDLLAHKAAHLRITPRELEKRLRAGDANPRTRGRRTTNEGNLNASPRSGRAMPS